jgi:hypothetical protein
MRISECGMVARSVEFRCDLTTRTRSAAACCGVSPHSTMAWHYGAAAIRYPIPPSLPRDAVMYHAATGPTCDHSAFENAELAASRRDESRRY